LRWYMYSSLINKLRRKTHVGIEHTKNPRVQRTWTSQTKTAKALGITYTSVSKYWNMSKEDYAREAEQEKYHMDNYRQYILEQLKICPQIRDTNIYLKLIEGFPDYKLNELLSIAT